MSLANNIGTRKDYIEEPEDDYINIGTMKRFTGGDEIKPRNMYVKMIKDGFCDENMSLEQEYDCVAIKDTGYYPSCSQCWNGYIFAHGKVFCNKCHISRSPTFEENVHKNFIDKIDTYCDKGHKIILDETKKIFICQK